MKIMDIFSKKYLVILECIFGGRYIFSDKKSVITFLESSSCPMVIDAFYILNNKKETSGNFIWKTDLLEVIKSE